MHGVAKGKKVYRSPYKSIGVEEVQEPRQKRPKGQSSLAQSPLI